MDPPIPWWKLHLDRDWYDSLFLFSPSQLTPPFSNLLQCLPLWLRRNHHSIHVRRDRLVLQRRRHCCVAHDGVPDNQHGFPAALRALLGSAGPARHVLRRGRHLHVRLSGLWTRAVDGRPGHCASADGSRWRRTNHHGHNY